MTAHRGNRSRPSNAPPTSPLPATWIHDNGILYLWPPDGVNPNTLTVEVARRRWAFDLTERSHVEIEGMEIFAAAVTMDRSRSCSADGLRIVWPCAQNDIRGGFNRDRAMNASSDGLGIVVGGTNNTVRNSVIAYSTGDGVSVFGTSNTVENCVIHDCNLSASDCAPVVCTGIGHAIRRNTLFNGGRSIVVHRYLESGRIESNHLHHAGLLSNDLGMTYTYQTDGHGTVIAYRGRAPDMGAFETGVEPWVAGSTIPTNRWMMDDAWVILPGHKGPCYDKTAK